MICVLHKGKKWWREGQKTIRSGTKERNERKRGGKKIEDGNGRLSKVQQAKEDERNKRKCQKHWWRRKGGQTWSPVEQTAMQSQPRLWGKGRWDKLQNSLTWRLISKFIYKAGSSLCLSEIANRFNVYRASKSLHYTKGGKTLGCHCDSSYSGRLNGKASGWHFCQISKSPQLAPHVEE